jgi:hypothetical protein
MPDDTWQVLLGAECVGPPSIQMLIAETERLLVHFRTLSASELRTLATNLTRIADYAESLAEWEQPGGPRNPTG